MPFQFSVVISRVKVVDPGWTNLGPMSQPVRTELRRMRAELSSPEISEVWSAEELIPWDYASLLTLSNRLVGIPLVASASAVSRT